MRRNNSFRSQRGRRRASFRPSLERLEGRLALAAFAVDSLLDTFAVDLATGQDADGHVTLRSALDAANSLGGSNTISVPAGLYKLANRDLGIFSDVTITGAAGTIIDGQQLSSVVYVTSDVHVAISNLTIQNGRSRTGGGINNYGSLVLTNVTIKNNVAIGLNGPAGTNGVAGQAGNAGLPGSDQAFGGGIENEGDLTIIGSLITGNLAQGGNGGNGGNGTAAPSPGANGPSGGAGGAGGRSAGGGIFNGGKLTIVDTVISNNQARGGNGGAGGNGAAGTAGQAGTAGGVAQPGQPGGAGGNGGDAGYGGDGGYATGGGIDNLGSLIVRTSLLMNNTALAGDGGGTGSPGAGGKGGDGGRGGDASAASLPGQGGTGGAGGNAGTAPPSGTGGVAFGGGIDAGGLPDTAIVIQNSTVYGNAATGGHVGIASAFQVAGGAGGKGGNGGNGGATFPGALGGAGGKGGNGASAVGQGIAPGAIAAGIDANVNDSSLSLIESCTIVANVASGPTDPTTANPGAAGPGGAGGIGGTGVIAGGTGAGGASGSAGTTSGIPISGFGGYGGLYSPIVSVRNSIVTGNIADSAPDASDPGPNSDFNLIGGDGKLGPLQDNGGPTQTLALLVGSPAIGMGDPALAGKSDGRGFLRRSPVDIGAFQTNVANSAPSFLVGPNQQAKDEDSLDTVVAWATKIAAGPSFESTQAVDFLISADKPELFLAGPSISASGTLTFKPMPNVEGTAIVTVRIHDNGGAADGGADTSPPQTFSIVITKPHPWLNAAKHLDVNADGHVVAGDALAIINQINAFGPGKLPPRTKFEAPYYDVNGDGSIAPNDALDVINAINAGTPGGEGEGFASAAADGDSAALTDLIALLASDALAPGVRSRRVRL